MFHPRIRRHRFLEILFYPNPLVNRRSFVQTGCFAALGGLAPLHAAASKVASKKKGCCGLDQETIAKLGGSWYYTWGTHGQANTPLEFVPMIKGRNDLQGEGALNKVREMKNITHLLGYNEPERGSQGNLTVEDALNNWPRLEKVALEKDLDLGSPAPSSDGPGMDYFHSFMAQAKTRKLRVDFVAVHWYRSRDAGAFDAFVDDLGKRYKIPVWVTEFNGWSGDEPENYKFLKDALRNLERNRHVERYAYMEPGKGSPLSLFKGDGSLSRLGELYRDAGA